MAKTTINDAGIAAFFQAIMGGGGGGNTQALIDADLARRKGQNLDADTYRTQRDAVRIDADTGRIGADTARIGADADRIRGVTDQNAVTTQGMRANQEAALALAQILGGDGFTSADPAAAGQARQRALSVLPLIEGGLTPEAIQGLTGGTIYANPQAFGNGADLSNVLLGTGAVDSYGQTRESANNQLMSDALAGEAEIAAENQRNQAGLDATSRDVDARLAAASRDLATTLSTPTAPGSRYDPRPTTGSPSGGRAPLAVTPSVLNGIRKEVETRVQQKFPGATLPPEVLNEVADAAAEAYTTGRDVAAAINGVLGELSTQRNDGGWFGRAFDEVTRTPVIPGLTGPAQTPASPAPAQAAPAPVANSGPPTVANAAQQIPPDAQRGQDANGRPIWFDQTTGKWRYGG